MQWPVYRHGSAFFGWHPATVENGNEIADPMMTMSGFAAAPIFLSWRNAFRRMGVVERMIVAYLGFIAASMLCFGALTFLSLLP